MQITLDRQHSPTHDPAHDHPVRVLLADDHPLYRRGVRMLLSAFSDFEVIGEASTGDEAIVLTRRDQPDVVIMDLQMPGITGIEATRIICEQSPCTSVLVVTMFGDDHSLHAAIAAGARGYMLKDADEEEMLRAVRAVGNGEAVFSPPSGRDIHLSDAVPPSDVCTFLIADIRGYTRFTLQHGDEAAANLAEWFADLTEEVVAVRDGRVIELRGDEALAIFSSPHQAIRAAVELQQRFAFETRHHPDLPLHVGIGIDAGKGVRVKNGFRGIALNRAARLCSLAAPGEVLVSETIVSLARTVDGLEYSPREPAELKGFDQPVQVLEVVPSVSTICR